MIAVKLTCTAVNKLMVGFRKAIESWNKETDEDERNATPSRLPTRRTEYQANCGAILVSILPPDQATQNRRRKGLNGVGALHG